MKTTYQVLGYDFKSHDFTKDFGEHNDLKIAIQIADYHTNSIVKEFVVCNGKWKYSGVIHASFHNDESEAFFAFKNNFPEFFL